DDRGLEGDRRALVRLSCPARAELERELLRPLVAWTCEGIDLAPLVGGDLRDDVRRGAEAVEPEGARGAAHRERAVADEARAHERGGLRVGVAGGDGEAVALVGDRVLGHPAVDVASGEARGRAQVLAAAAAPVARAVAPAEPGNADALADPGAGALRIA